MDGYYQPECVRCADRCRCKAQSDYCREHLFAWATDRVVSCDLFRESRYHGRERIIVIPDARLDPFMVMR